MTREETNSRIEQMKIFSGSANKPLAAHIAKKLQTNISPIEMFTFPDGERRI